MTTVLESEIDIFSGQLPSIEQLYKLGDAVNSSQAAMADFAQKAQKAQQEGKNLAAGIAFSILGLDSEAVENLQKAENTKEKFMYLGWSLRKMGDFDSAIKAFDKVGSGGAEVVMEKVAVLRDKGDLDAAEKLLESISDLEKVSADYHYQKGRVLERLGQYQKAIDNYEQAIELDGNCRKALFHIAFASDLHGDEDAAIDYYNQLLKIRPVCVSALLNLAVLYEDREDYKNACWCIDLVLKYHPNHQRAVLFRKDVASSMNMFIDEEQEKRIGKRNQILEIPISDFELSVRSRNCLKKMNIRTLGDLASISESELLSYKNFGETSLKEIKAIIESKGLKLGSLNEDKADEDDQSELLDADNEMLVKSVMDLTLSVRAKKALDRLGIRTLGELCRRTEAELLGCKNFGVTSLNEIKEALTTVGLELRKLS